MDGNSKEDDGLVKRINGVVFVLILGLVLVGTALPMNAQEDNIVARVNGVDITLEQFVEALEEQYGFAVLEQLIIDQLISQKVASTGVSVSDEDFAVLYEQFVQEMGGPEYMAYFLYQYGITEEQLKEELMGSMLLSELAMSEIEVNTDDITAWFEEHRYYYDRPETVTASHILVDSQEEAERLLAELESGADFAALAQQYSLDPGTAANGGYLGPIERGVTVEPFENMAFSLNVNEMGIAESQYGWHIILVSERTDSKAAVLADIYDVVEADYKRSLAPTAAEYLMQLEQEATIEILRERYQPAQ